MSTATRCGPTMRQATRPAMVAKVTASRPSRARYQATQREPLPQAPAGEPSVLKMATAASVPGSRGSWIVISWSKASFAGSAAIARASVGRRHGGMAAQVEHRDAVAGAVHPDHRPPRQPRPGGRLEGDACGHRAVGHHRAAGVKPWGNPAPRTRRTNLSSSTLGSEVGPVTVGEGMTLGLSSPICGLPTSCFLRTRQGGVAHGHRSPNGRIAALRRLRRPPTWMAPFPVDGVRALQAAGLLMAPFPGCGRRRRSRGGPSGTADGGARRRRARRPRPGAALRGARQCGGIGDPLWLAGRPSPACEPRRRPGASAACGWRANRCVWSATETASCSPAARSSVRAAGTSSGRSSLPSTTAPR